MNVQAYHLGQKLQIRELQAALKFSFSFKDPYVVEYPQGRYVALFRYGVAVFWGFSKGEMNEFLGLISPFIQEPLKTPDEETITVKVGKKRNEIRSDEIHLETLSVSEVALISLILGRTIALDYFEREVETALKDFGQLLEAFQKDGRTSHSSKALLKKVAVAMNIRYNAVTQMALLDKPDITWEDSTLDAFYHELEAHFEIEDRYSILSEKLKFLFQNVEFILNFLEGRRSYFVEVVIVVLILIELLVFFYETYISWPSGV